ncbi:MAG: CAP domain-containing protein [Candidatus Entotheonellia bacterium]
MIQRLVWILILACFLMPRGVYGQTAEEGDAEAIQAPAKSPQGKEAPDLSELAKLIIRRTNELRQEEGRQTVEVNPKHTETAQYFANYMARTNKYGHTADGNRPAERVKKHAYDYCILSENIAYQHSSTGFTTDALAQELFEGWTHSPGHRKNMLNADVTETGVAVAQSEETGYYYAVQLFGRPSSKRIEFQIVNHSDAIIQYEIGTRTFSLPPRYTRTHQRCGPTELTLQWPDGPDMAPKQESKTVQPNNGERYTIIQKESGELSVRRE